MVLRAMRLASATVAILGLAGCARAVDEAALGSRADTAVEASGYIDGRLNPSRYRTLMMEPPSPQALFSIDDLLNSLFDGLGGGWGDLFGGDSSSSSPAKPSTPDGPVNPAPDTLGIQNALGIGQDPGGLSRVEADGVRRYYFPTNDFDRNIYMQSSDDLNTTFADPANEKTVFTYKKRVGTEAPFLYQWDDKTYLMYVSSVGPEGDGAMRVLQSKSEDLLGEWIDLGEMKDAKGDRLVDYDGYAFSHPNGKRYFMYSALRSVWIAELVTPITLGRAVPFATGDGARTIEAPGGYIAGDTINLYWSENVFAEANYNVINRAFNVKDDPLNPRSWMFSLNTTILSASGTVYGPGSAGTFEGPDGKPWMAYSCYYGPGESFPLTENPRRIQAQPLIISSDGVLQPMAPAEPVRFLGRDV